MLAQFTDGHGNQDQVRGGARLPPVIRTRLNAGNPPGRAILPRPGFVDELARDDALIPLEDMGLDVDMINENYSDTWTTSRPSGHAYGVVAKANSKSTVWYKPNSFQQNGFEVPKTWDQLGRSSELPQVEGRGSVGGRRARPRRLVDLTDWFEQIYPDRGWRQLRQAVLRRLPFNDATVKEALEIMLKQVNDKCPRRRRRGSASASRTASRASSDRTRKPRCTCSAASRAGSPWGEPDAGRRDHRLLPVPDQGRARRPARRLR